MSDRACVSAKKYVKNSAKAGPKRAYRPLRASVLLSAKAMTTLIGTKNGREMRHQSVARFLGLSLLSNSVVGVASIRVDARKLSRSSGISSPSRLKATAS
jgi:hypothetical protein